MKTILLTFTFLLLGNLSFAQLKLIAIKGATTDTIATTLADAITLAQPNDKIYLPGGYFSYAGVLEKPLHIIGTGFQDGMNVFGRTIINGDFGLNDLSNGSVFEGFYLAGNFVGYNVSSITIKRCNFNGITENGTWNNCHFVNCVGRGNIYLGQGYVGNGASNLIENSIIYYVAYAQYSTFSNCIIAKVHASGDVLLKNNVLYAYCDILDGSTNVILTNNLFQSACIGSGYNGAILSESNSIGFSTFNDIFVSASSFEFNPSNNFQLVSSSTGNNAGTDGTDIGIFGGNYPWKVGSLPINPNIEQNNSYLDVLNEEFKLNVKVVPQTN